MSNSTISKDMAILLASVVCIPACASIVITGRRLTRCQSAPAAQLADLISRFARDLATRISAPRPFVAPLPSPSLSRLSNPIVVIPARLGSTRLPGKPLADIHGEPMIVHVWRRAREADVGPVLVAADAPEIVAAIEAAGGASAC